MAGWPQMARIALVVVLGIVLVVVLLIRFGILPIGSGKGGSPAVPAPTGKIEEAPTPVHETSLRTGTKWKRPDPVGPLPRDPTLMDTPRAAVRPGEGSNATLLPSDPEYVVTGIFFNAEQRSSVMIDGDIFHEGDTIHGAAITKITEGYAELRREGKEWLIKPGEHYRGSEVIRPGK